MAMTMYSLRLPQDIINRIDALTLPVGSEPGTSAPLVREALRRGLDSIERERSRSAARTTEAQEAAGVE